MFRLFVHYGIHFLVPLLIVFIFFKDRKVEVLLILMAGMLIDLDHLLANPIFDPNRCSIGFHPLHSHIAILVYCALPFFKRMRLLGLGLIIHIAADIADCLLL
ncbi:DUF6122 family protein [Flagellimonas sp. 2504JD1-5]